MALCAIISRLACYPQPLLRSFLLNPYLILQPSIPGLASSIATLKQRIDCALNVNENARTLIQEARLRLDAKIAGVDPSQQMVSTAANRGIQPLDDDAFLDFFAHNSAFFSRYSGQEQTVAFVCNL